MQQNLSAQNCSGNIKPYALNSLKHHISRRRIRKSSISAMPMIFSILHQIGKVIQLVEITCHRVIVADSS